MTRGHPGWVETNQGWVRGDLIGSVYVEEVANATPGFHVKIRTTVPMSAWNPTLPGVFPTREVADNIASTLVGQLGRSK